MSNRRFGLTALVGVALVGLVAGMVFTAKLDVFNQANGQESKHSTPATHKITSEDFSGQPLTFDAFRKIAKKMNPTVVNIYTTQIVRSPFSDFFDDPFFRRFFGDAIPDRPQRQSSLGSGVIIDTDGHILTNNHVIENADEIRVSLEDDDTGRNGLIARVVGRDPKTDIALIKINPKEKLTAAPLGDSDAIQVGDWVIAIGNPFGFGHTVTVGVVSAKGRALTGGSPFEDFIQTDASINPGNSGGPLLNLQGEVIGINTAIATRTGQSAGIGFAVPINMAKEILPQLKTTGRVVRGQLGVTIQSNPEVIKRLGAEYGVVITDVTEGSAADKAGLKRGDVIIEYNGKPLREGNELPRLVAATKPGTKVKIKILRDGKEKTLDVIVGTMKDTELETGEEESKEESSSGIGISVTDLDSQTARQLNLDSDEGVLITRVRLNSPADDAGLQRGDVILEIDRKPIRNMEEYRDATAKIKPGSTLLFLVYRRGNTIFVPVTIPEKERE